MRIAVGFQARQAFCWFLHHSFYHRTRQQLLKYERLKYLPSTCILSDVGFFTT